MKSSHKKYGFTRFRSDVGFLKDLFPYHYLVHWDLAECASSPQVPAALFSVGDGHYAQGDGESPKWSVPRNCIATIGTSVREDGDLSLACRNALVNMIELLERRGYTRDQAYVICSVAVDLHITNLVNRPNVAVSAFLCEIFEN